MNIEQKPTLLQKIEQSIPGLDLFKKSTAVLVASFLMMQAAEASPSFPHKEDHDKALEIMKTSPEKVRAYEAQILYQLEDSSVIKSDTLDDGSIHDLKMVKVDDEVAILVEYEKDGTPLSFNIREYKGPDSKIILHDGSDGKGIDGAVDGVTIHNQQTKHQFFFKNNPEKTSDDDQSLVITDKEGNPLRNIQNPGYRLVTAQQSLEQVLKSVNK